MTASSFLRSSEPTLGLRHAPWMLIDPVAVFRRMEDTKAYGWTLATLLVMTTLIGLATVETGLIDVGVDQQTEQAIAKLEAEQADLINRMEFAKRVQDLQKAGEFNKLMTRAGAVVAAPLQLLVSVMVIASLLYAAVALSGRKPEYHTLMSICVFASVVELLAAGLRLGLMIGYRTIYADTSLGLLVPWSPETKALKDALAAIDPFRVWFWILVVIGLVVTRQLGRRSAIVSCVLFALVATGVRMVPMQTAMGGAPANNASVSVEVD